ncbi:MAG: rRNA methyltransferase [Chitinophagaceae bacterium]|nr:rRNA methyltransferase [Chitinophagaceae bacterium]
MEYHVPVLLEECIDGLIWDEKGTYVDVTFGGGGHSARILEALKGGTLYGVDQDSDAAKNTDQFKSNRSFKFIAGNFRYLSKYLRMEGVREVQGILGDLGVSSHQFDTADRGFSIRFDGELDMRMDKSEGVSAKDLLNTYAEEQLVHMFSMYGEVKNSKTLAREICRFRIEKKFETTMDLKESAWKVAPKGYEMKYLAQVFQAIRIEVNDEMGALRDLLQQAEKLLVKGGRLVIISYHSLEDRLVKDYMNAGNFQGIIKKDLYGNDQKPFQLLTRKPVLPSEDEYARNSRSRSAKLRIAVKR